MAISYPSFFSFAPWALPHTSAAGARSYSVVASIEDSLEHQAATAAAVSLLSAHSWYWAPLAAPALPHPGLAKPWKAVS
jgi:hypothetical protein